MSVIVAISILVLVIAIVWSVVVLRRMRDWRMAFLTVMLLLMAGRQIASMLTAARQAESWTLAWGASITELLGLIVSVMALCAVYLVPRILCSHPSAEQSLHDREARIQAILNTAADAIITINHRGIIESFNPAAVRLFGYFQADVTGKNVNILMPEPYRSEHNRYISHYLRTGKARIIGIGREVEARRRDGSVFPIELAVSEFTVGGRRLFAGVVRDITDRKQAEQEREVYQQRLRSLTSELALTEERQRREIATELHDQIGQNLAIAKIKLGQLREAGQGTELSGPVDEVRSLVEQTIDATRTLTFELGSPILYELGLEAAIESMGEDLWDKHGIRSSFQDNGPARSLSEDLRAVLYQSVREALNNIVRHAEAQTVELSVIRDRQTVRIIVADDGVGFIVPRGGFQASSKGGFGLFNVSERLGHLGGELHVESEPGKGTKVTLTAPLTSPGPTPRE